MAREQLDRAGVARVLGVSPATISGYLSKARFPPPDGRVGNSPWWWASTIERWRRTRPGSGAGGGRRNGVKIEACAGVGQPAASIGEAGICPICDKAVALTPDRRFVMHGRVRG